MVKKTPLKLVAEGVATEPQPPKALAEHGANLWRSIMADYDISDSGGRAMLLQACQALDRAEALRDEIDCDGEVIRTRGLIKEHPAIRHELQLRAFIVRTLSKLGLNFEPVNKTTGRPPRSLSWEG